MPEYVIIELKDGERPLRLQQLRAAGEHLADILLQNPLLAVGPGRRDDEGKRVPMDVKVGDKVLYSKYGGTEVHFKGEEYLIVSARDLLAVVND